MLKKVIHIIQANIRANAKTEEGCALRPTITCKTYKKTYWFDDIEIKGESILKYSQKPLGCGARVWIETKAKVIGTVDGVSIEVE